MKKKLEYGLGLKIIDKLQAVFQAYPQIDKVWIYGSRALGNFRPGSDIDLCIESSTLKLTHLLAIENQIDDLLLPWKVDLSLKKAIDNPALLEHIELYGQQFYP